MELTKDMIKDSGDCIVKFTAPWCGACKTLSALLDKILENSSIAVFICDVSESSFQQEYGVISLPTVIRFKDGKEIARLTGVTSVNNIKDCLGI